MSAIDQDGNLLWNTGRITWIPEDDYSYESPSLLPTNDGNFIIIYKISTGPGWGDSRFVYAQRLDMSGRTVWQEEAHINDVGGLTLWDKLSIKADNEGGFFVAWDDDRDHDQLREAFIQHVDASGNLLFMLNGLLVSTEYAQRFYPVVAGSNDENEIFVYWKQTLIGKIGSDALFGQRISQGGTRMWTDKGKRIISPDMGLAWILGCDFRNNLSFLFYVMYGTNPGDQRIRSKCIDKQGNPAWESDSLSVSESQKEITLTFVSDYSEGEWILAWTEIKDSIEDLYAQNVNENGSIGNTTGIGEYDQQEIDIYPNPCHETLNISQNGYQQLYLINLAGQVVLEKKITQGATTLDVSGLNPGVYILKLGGQKGIAVYRMGVVNH
jgi:hypothetical protein